MKIQFFAIQIAALTLCSCLTANMGTPPGDEPAAVEGAAAQEEYLVYTIIENTGRRRLMYYDVNDHTRTQILPDWNIDGLAISADDRLAFSASLDGTGEIYVLEHTFHENQPVNITHDPVSDDRLISWSLDGHFLAYESARPDGKTLVVWDGDDFISVHRFQGQIGDTTWSKDGRLAFTDFHPFAAPNDGDPSEVLVWDGEIVNFSQNPSGEDRFPAWSADGQLAILSQRNGDHGIFVWDGVSNHNGIPDKTSYKEIAPDLTDYYSRPVWTNSGSMTFGGDGPWDFNIQIYEWDGRTASNISQNPFHHNGGQTWRQDGYRSFVAEDANGPLIYIRDDNNQTLFTSEGQFPPAWSRNGLLLYCAKAPSGWILSLWDGTQAIEIARGNTLQATWRNGTGVFCSSG